MNTTKSDTASSSSARSVSKRRGVTRVSSLDGKPTALLVSKFPQLFRRTMHRILEIQILAFQADVLRAVDQGLKDMETAAAVHPRSSSLRLPRAN
jgi:hypothetical protein